MNPVSIASAAIAASLFCASVSSAQTFTYPDFSNISTLNLNGSSAQQGTALRLTDLAQNQTGTAFHDAAVPVLAGFDTQFDFTIIPGPVLAEGMAFVIQDSPSGSNALGGAVWGLGYGVGANNSPITNSIAIELDTFQDGFLNDTSNNEISVHTRGTVGNDENEIWSIGRVTPGTFLSNSAVHTMRVTYVPGTLEIYVDDLVNPVLSVPYDFQTGGTRVDSGQPVGGMNLPNATAFVGFAASTGANQLNERVLIHNWTWTSSAGLNACYEGTVGADVLQINNSAGGFFRRVEVNAFDPFSIDIGSAPGQATSAFVVFGTLGAADGSMTQPLPVGTMCFPATSIVIPGNVAPLSLPIPGLPITATITLQGIMGLDPSNSSILALTNAIVLDLVSPPSPVISQVTPTVAQTGDSVTINGSGFSVASSLSVGGAPVTPTSITSESITFAMPAGVGCDSSVVLTNPDGQSDSIGINGTPIVTNTIPPQGPAAGGANYIIVGSSFGAGSTVTIGGTPVTPTTASASVLVMTTPPGTPGPAQVVVTNPAGCQVTTTYTYL